MAAGPCSIIRSWIVPAVPNDEGTGPQKRPWKRLISDAARAPAAELARKPCAERLKSAKQNERNEEIAVRLFMQSHQAESSKMKKALTLVILLAVSGAANAAIPALNASCPGNIEVHADAGGPVFINGKASKLKKFNDNYYEAKGDGVTLSVSINPDGSAAVSYTKKDRVNGVCEVREPAA